MNSNIRNVGLQSRPIDGKSSLCPFSQNVYFNILLDINRIPIKNSGIKDMQSIVALPHKALWVAVVGNDKAGILDIKSKRLIRYVYCK